MKPSFGIGVLLIVLVTAAVGLLGVVGVQGAISMLLLLAGLWAVVAAFAIVESKDRTFYAGWGIIIAGLSLSYFVPIQDALAVILLAIVGLVVATMVMARKPPQPAAPATVAAPSS